MIDRYEFFIPCLARDVAMRFSLIAFALLSFVAQSASAKDIDLTVAEPSGVERRGWPVTSGIPLAQGELRSDRRTALFDADGKEIPLQTEVLNRWPDGTIRWLLLDFQVDLAANQSKRYVLRYGPQIKRSSVPDPIHVNTIPQDPVLETGPLRITLSPDEFRLLDAVWHDRNNDGQFSDSERVTGGDAAGIELVTPDGERYRADLSHAVMTIEQHGPLRACVRIEGSHQSLAGGQMFNYVVRLHVFRGQSFVKFDYTFINDHQDTLMAKFDSIELVCSMNSAGDDRLILDRKNVTTSRLEQVDDLHYSVNGQETRGHAPGWAAVAAPTGGFAVGVREFWQNWPKSIETKTGELRIGLCPDFPDGRYDGRPLAEEVKHYYYLRDGVYTVKVGVARTHDMWATFFADDPAVDELSDFFAAAERTLLAQCDPDYTCATGVLGGCPPADPNKYYGYDAWMDAMFDKHLEDQEDGRENGMLNFGDWYDVKKFGGGWGNLEYDTAHCFFVQYLRSGDRRYFDRARQGAQHTMDVDVAHAVNRHLRNVDHAGIGQPGHIWTHSVGHTGGYYEHAPLEAPTHYQTGMLQNWGHVWIGGLCDHYLLTGDRRTRDVLVRVADRVASECPTRFSDHMREIGWPLNLVLTAYETTSDDKYLAAADRQWERLKSHLDPDRGWVVMLAYGHCSAKDSKLRCRGQNSYLLALTLSGLARYHQLTGDPEVLEAVSAGLDQMIRECWSEEHKSFYATSCKHVMDRPPGAYCPTTLLASLAFAHEIASTGNAEHRRIFNEAFKTTIEAGRRELEAGHEQFQAGYGSRAFHFTPFGLRALRTDGGEELKGDDES